MRLREKVELSRLAIAYAIEKHPRIFATCSFGKDSRVLVDLVLSVRSDLPFVGIDTGYEFPETLSFADALVRSTGMSFRWLHPPVQERRRIEAEFGPELILGGRYRCCAMKLPALAPVLGSFDAWLTGLRRDESPSREEIPLVESGTPVKVHPLAFWTHDDIWSYIRENGLDYHPLYDAGYPSLGCAPCTRPPSDGDAAAERSGRFVGSAHPGEECGLHSSPVRC